MENENKVYNLPDEAEYVKKSDEKKPSKVKGVVIAVVSLLVFLGVQLGVSTIASVIKSIQVMAEVQGNMDIYLDKYMEAVGGPEFLTPVMMVTEFALILIGIIWYYLGYVKKTDAEVKKTIKSKVFKSRTIFSAILLGTGFYAFDMIIATVFSTISPESADNFSEMMNMVFDFSNPLSLLVLTIVGPIAEELFFRGIALNTIKRNWSKWPAIIISSLLFAGMHLVPLQIAYVIPIALIMGYVAYQYNSLIPTIIIHIVNNTISSFASYLPEKILNSMIFFIGVAVVCIFAGLFIDKDNLFNKKENN